MVERKKLKIPRQITSLTTYKINWECQVCGEDDWDSMCDDGANLVVFDDGLYALVCKNCMGGLERLFGVKRDTITHLDKEFIECARCSLRFQCYTTRSKELKK